LFDDVPSLPFVGPPLSLTNTSRDVSQMPARFIASVTLRTPSSSIAAIAATCCRSVLPPVVLAKRSTYACGASSGQCTFCHARYRKKGPAAACVSMTCTARAAKRWVLYELLAARHVSVPSAKSYAPWVSCV